MFGVGVRVLLLLSACATLSPSATPPPDVGWSELTSEHFDLWIHGGDAERGQRLIREMEYACMTDGFYATAWALFTFLSNVHRAELTRYEQALVALAPDAKAPAWDEIVPELPAAKLQEELIAWLAHGNISVSRYDVVPKVATVAQHPLTAADAQAARALVHYQFDPASGGADLAAALASERTNLVASLIRAKREGVSLDEARAVAEAHPDDWRGWWLLGSTAHRSGSVPEMRSAREHLCDAAARDPNAGLPPGFGCPTAP